MKGHQDSNKNHTLTITEQLNVKVDKLILQRAITQKKIHVQVFPIVVHINNKYVPNTYASAKFNIKNLSFS